MAEIKEHDLKKEREKIAKEKTRDNPGINSKLREGDVDQQLDKALMDSFPSSDPPSLTQPTENQPAGPAPKKDKKEETI